MINIGTYGPFIMILLALWRLYYLPKYLIWFLGFLWINEAIIVFAKQTIQQLRPRQQVLVPTRPNYGISSLGKFVFYPLSFLHDLEYYGMPSGHAQHALFITSFLWLVNPSWAVLCLCIVITGIIIMERYNTSQHTLEQLMVGGINGVCIAYILVLIFRKYYEYF